MDPTADPVETENIRDAYPSDTSIKWIKNVAFIEVALDGLPVAQGSQKTGLLHPLATKVRGTMLQFTLHNAYKDGALVSVPKQRIPVPAVGSEWILFDDRKLKSVPYHNIIEILVRARKRVQ